MNVREIYDAYFDAFEVAFDSDDWSAVEPFFTKHVVYKAPRGGTVQGRDAVLAQFKVSLDEFDRRFPIKRRIEVVDGDVVEKDAYLKVPGNVHYVLPDAPELIFYMEEEVWFEEGRIARLEDTILPEEGDKMAGYVTRYLGGENED